MNQKFLIRTIAAKLLEMLYLQSDSYLKATISPYEIIDEYFDELTIQKAGRYLSQKKLVETDEMPSKTWTATITFQGIDWLEDWNDSNN